METLPTVLRRRFAPFPTGLLENRLGRVFGPEYWRDIEEPFGWGPDMDLVDSNGEMILTAELPGMKEEDVEVSVTDGVLTLKGEKKQASTRKDASFRISERSYGSFERSFTLPRSVNTEAIVADFEDGVLTVHFPKVEEAKGRQIKIGGK